MEEARSVRVFLLKGKAGRTQGGWWLVAGPRGELESGQQGVLVVLGTGPNQPAAWMFRTPGS